MAPISPLHRLHQQAEASLAPYGAPLPGTHAPVELVETFGELELEYAALRKACILIDQPHRGTLEITGKDRLEFLNRMITQEVRTLEPFRSRRAFWLNRKGRIDADLRVTDLGDRTLLDLDIHAAERTAKGLSDFLFSEDAQIGDASRSVHRLALHGPTALALLRAAGKPESGPPLEDLGPRHATVVTIAGKHVVVERDDTTGEVGLELTTATDDAAAVYQQLLEIGQEHNGGSDTASQIRLRPAGWHAYNIARIEAGTPIYNLDFGPDSLPHETGVIADRVSFKKGCYLGQEIVARMESRGHPKQRLVALRCKRLTAEPTTPTEPGAPALPLLPDTGALVYAADQPEGDPVGAVTSATLSPMLGSSPICFAMVRFAHSDAGRELLVAAEGTRLESAVQPSLTFWKR